MTDTEYNKGVWGGLVTIEKDGQEVIMGWYGTPDMAVYVAQNAIKTKRTTGARAYAIIGAFGKYATERPPEPTDGEEPAEEEPAEGTPQVTMDRWFS